MPYCKHDREAHKGWAKTIAYKQLGLSMDIETKVVQHVSSPKESNNEIPSVHINKMSFSLGGPV